MAELADALDLGSSGRPCRFKSCWPHAEPEMHCISGSELYSDVKVAKPSKRASRELFVAVHGPAVKEKSFLISV